MGNSAVGKSSLVARFTTNEFKRDSKSTIGVEFSTKSMQLGDKRVKAQIWDTAGQERYRSITSSYYRGAVGALLVYDVTDSNSFDDLHVWLKEVRENAEEDCRVMLCGNKCDLGGGDQQRRRVHEREAHTFARNNGLAFIETSAKDATGVDEAFKRILEEICKTQGKKQLTRSHSKQGYAPRAGQKLGVQPPIDLTDQAEDVEKKSVGGCCASA
jgi:small GTP-binding protein